MNKLEALVYQVVKRNPRMKNLVRDVYQAIFAMVPGPREQSKFPVIAREGYFFGFHDKKPWSANNRYLLAHGYHLLKNIEPGPGDKVDIGSFQGEDFSEFRKITNSSCFNWQQGSMLQWVGRSENFIFNDAGGDNNVARIFDVNGKPTGILPNAIAAIEPSGKKALSYNFARLQQYFPGYGYVHGKDPENGMETPSTHGISITDLGTGQVSRLFTVADIANITPEKSMTGAFHFLTHCLFSPTGNRFIFLHRWIKDGNFTFTRMFSCDVNGQDIHLFPTRDMVSHIAWQDDDHVLAYCRSVENRDAYILFRDKSTEYRLIGTEAFTSDGHPSFPGHPSDWFLTDTYPDRFRRSYLILYNMLKEERTDLGFFRQPYSYREAIRCDLHPRWNNTGTMICFDSAHTGKRSLCTMNTRDFLSTGIQHPLKHA